MGNPSKLLRILMLGTVMITGFGAAQVVMSDQVLADNDDDDNGDRGRRGREDGLDLYLTKTIDATAIKPPGEMYVGSGNTVVNFMLKRNLKDDVEIAVKAKIRQGPDLRPTYVDADGIVHIEVPTGRQLSGPPCMVPVPPPLPTACDRAAWSYDYSISTAIDGSMRELDDFDGTMRIDLDPSPKVKYLTLKLARQGPPMPPPADDNGWGWKKGNMFVIADDEGTQAVTQNSRQIRFLGALIDTDPNTPGIQPYDTGPGEFDFEISMTRKGANHDDDDDDGGRRKSSTTVHVVFNVVPVPTP